MAQHSLKWTTRPAAQRQLGVDKACVILGFLLGLPLGLGVVQDALAAAGGAESLQVAGLIGTVALTTLAGAQVGAWLARHLRGA